MIMLGMKMLAMKVLATGIKGEYFGQRFGLADERTIQSCLVFECEVVKCNPDPSSVVR